MLQSSEPIGGFSTLFRDPSERKKSVSCNADLRVPEQRHAEAVMRRLLRGQRSSAEPLQERVHEAAAVIGRILTGNESDLFAGSLSEVGRRSERSAVDFPAVCCSRRKRSIAARLARRVVQSITRSSRLHH